VGFYAIRGSKHFCTQKCKNFYLITRNSLIKKKILRSPKRLFLLGTLIVQNQSTLFEKSKRGSPDKTSWYKSPMVDVNVPEKFAKRNENPLDSTWFPLTYSEIKHIKPVIFSANFSVKRTFFKSLTLVAQMKATTFDTLPNLSLFEPFFTSVLNCYILSRRSVIVLIVFVLKQISFVM